jgi:hypothetical protein
MENYKYDNFGGNVIGGGIASDSFPLSLLLTRKEQSAEDDMIAKKKRKKAVARFVALTTSAADGCSGSVISSPDSVISQMLGRILQVVTDLEQEILTEYKMKILNTQEVR